MTQFELRKDDKGNDSLFKIDEDGREWSVPMLAGNADYEAYLNPVEHLTEIIPSEAKVK